MRKEKQRLEPAFPATLCDSAGRTISFSGIDKRFYAACTAIQGILSNSNPDLIMWGEEKVVGYAYKIADELLKQEGL